MDAWQKFTQQPDECGDTCSPESHFAQRAWNGAIKTAQARIALIMNSVEEDFSDEQLEQLIQEDLSDLISK